MIAGFLFMTSNNKKKNSRSLSRSLFVTFEGIDGCGKTTQLKLAAKHLRSLGYSVQTFREPGSTAVSEKIRKILLDRRSEMSDLTELMLYEAARTEIVAAEILPALKNGEIVLCDRFYDSTTAYQGYGRKLNLKMIQALHRIVAKDAKPDLTFVFDLDLRRAFSRRGTKLDRLEAQSRAFHQRVRKGFQQIAAKESGRVKLIDATRSVEIIFADLSKHLNRRLRTR